MLIKVLRSKIHRARVTEARLDYEGSLTVDADLLDAAGMVPGEAILVANISNGTRHETYLIAGERGSGTVCLNGAAARLGAPGDLVIILAFAYLRPEELAEHRPRKILVDEHNRYIRDIA